VAVAVAAAVAAAAAAAAVVGVAEWRHLRAGLSRLVGRPLPPARSHPLL